MKIKYIYYLFFAILLGACSRVSTNVDKSANFGVYKTYAWVEPDIKVDNPLYKSDLIDRDIKRDVSAELAKRGIVESDNDPDLLLEYHTFTQQKQQIYGSYYGYPYGGMYPYGGFGMGYGYGGFGAFGGPSVYTYNSGTLILDFTDSHNHQLIWRGSINGDVTNVRKLGKDVDKAVHAIMKKYPLTEKGEIHVRR